MPRNGKMSMVGLKNWYLMEKLILFVLLSHYFVIVYQMTSRQSVENKICNKGLQKKYIFEQINLKMSKPLHIKVTVYTLVILVFRGYNTARYRQIARGKVGIAYGVVQFQI